MKPVATTTRQHQQQLRMKNRQMKQANYARTQRQRDSREKHSVDDGATDGETSEEYRLASLMRSDYRQWRQDAKEADAVVFMINLSDRKFTDKARANLFHSLRAMLHPVDDHYMRSHLTRLLAYYNTVPEKRKSPPPTDRVASHVILCWSTIAPDVRRALMETPHDVFLLPHYDRGLDCFALHERVANYVHLQNWNVRHGTKNEDGDAWYTQEFVDCITHVKRFYLKPGGGVNHLVVDIFPIAATMQFFTLVVGFQLSRRHLDAPPDEVNQLCDRFKHALEKCDADALAPLLADQVYRTRLPNGDSVIRLYYFPTVCMCTMMATAHDDIKTTQCPVCGEIYYCHDGCESWRECCADAVS